MGRRKVRGDGKREREGWGGERRRKWEKGERGRSGRVSGGRGNRGWRRRRM